MEGHDPIISWEFAVSICPQPLSIAEMTTKERAIQKTAGDLAVLLMMAAALRGWARKLRDTQRPRWSGRPRDREMQAGRHGETEILGRRRQQAIGRPSDTGGVKKFRLRNTGRGRDSQRWAEKLHTRKDQKWGQMDHGWADRPSSAFSRLARSPHLPGKLPTAAAATIKPDSSLALAPLPFALPPPITPAIIFLVQNELPQL